MNFFKAPAVQAEKRAGSHDGVGKSPLPPSLSVADKVGTYPGTPSKPQKSVYEKNFLDFFVHDDVTVAPINRFERDEASTELAEKNIDSYLAGGRSPKRKCTLNAEVLFHLSTYSSQPRGKICMPVREIMTELYSDATHPIDLTTDSQTTDSQAVRVKRATTLLREIRMKFLGFREDVRPAYRGTYTSRPVSGMQKLARNPMRRDLPNTNYDYDSEAEWVEEDVADAEDLGSEDEEEEDDDGDDMNGFLDDENDEMRHARHPGLQGDLEPTSTGLCWENREGKNENVKLITNRMEIILGKLFGHRQIFGIIS
jgi:chromatin assembly factor 1 subunit A